MHGKRHVYEPGSILHEISRFFGITKVAAEDFGGDAVVSLADEDVWFGGLVAEGGL